jgi:hypothetical protein
MARITVPTPSIEGMTLLQSLALSGSSVTSSSFSSAYKQIFVYIEKAYASTEAEFRLRLNAHTGSDYAWQNTQFAAAAGFGQNSNDDKLKIGTMSGSSRSENRTYTALYIMNPANTSGVFINSNAWFADSANDTRQIRMAGVYNNTAAITSITLFVGSGTFTAGTAYIYGVN